MVFAPHDLFGRSHRGRAGSSLPGDDSFSRDPQLGTRQRTRTHPPVGNPLPEDRDPRMRRSFFMLTAHGKAAEGGRAEIADPVVAKIVPNPVIEWK
jgi:hypothetical protein